MATPTRPRRSKNSETNPASTRSTERARLSLDVSPDLRRRIKLIAVRRDLTVREFAERALLREVENEEKKLARAEGKGWSAISEPSFARDWNSDQDSAYDQL